MAGKLEELENQDHKSSLKSKLFRLTGWWIAFTGLYAIGSGSICPFCGKPGCPVGAGSAGLIGSIFALMVQSFSFLRNRLLPKKLSGAIKHNHNGHDCHNGCSGHD
jgi:hypothetical protein